MDWQPIDTAPTRKDGVLDDCRIVIAYFGGDSRLDGFATVGHFFQWDEMDRRLAADWPLAKEPTHWLPLPKAPDA